MTIEEAIEHCKDVAKESKAAALTYARENAYETAISCKAFGQEHEQLAEWLTELKQRIEAEITAPPKSNADRIRQMTDEELARFLDITSGCSICFLYATAGECAGFRSSMDCIVNKMKWLKQEVSEDDSGGTRD